eukprot:2508821-Lingulodinium_polyedra.AAC.1
MVARALVVWRATQCGPNKWRHAVHHMARWGFTMKERSCLARALNGDVETRAQRLRRRATEGSQ